MTAPFQIALAGAWHVHFDQYASELAAREDCRLTVLWDSQEERGRSAAAKYGCDFEPDYDRLLARPDVQGVAITSETSLHPELIRKAALSGKHIYTEKVLCFDYQTARELAEVVKESGVKFCISFPFLCRPEYVYAKQAVETGMLGQITYARVRDAHDGATAGWLPDYFFDEAICGGGAMMDLGAHPMYLLADLFGTPNSVSSAFTKVTGRAVEDNAVSLLEFGGLIASSETGFVSKGCPFMLELNGVKGTLLWNGEGLSVNTGDGFVKPELPQGLKTPTDQWADGVLYGGEIRAGAEDAARLTLLMEKAYQSSREGRKIPF